MYGGRGDGVADDSAAFQELFSQSGDLATLGGGEVCLGPKTYVVNTMPPGANAIIPLPVLGGSVRIAGVSGLTTIKTTRTGDTFTSGDPPAVFGMSLFAQHYGRWEFDGLIVDLPADPALGGINMSLAGRLHIKDVQVKATNHGSLVPTHKHSVGVRLPGALNFGEVYCESLYCLGMYCGIAFSSTAHVVLINPIAKACCVGYGIEDGGGVNGGHSSAWFYAMSEHNKHHIAGWAPALGAQSLPPDRNPAYVIVHQLDIEDGPPPLDTIDHILDTNDMLRGSVGYHRWGLSVTPDLVVSGARNLDRRPVGLGHLGTARTSPPAESELAPGQAALWLDPTNDAARLMVTAKTADGAMKTGSIPLS